MNAVTNAINEVKFRIPYEVLHIAFKEQSDMINTAITLDEMILNKVIRPRVLTDCNLVGGTSILVDSNKCDITAVNPLEFVIKVPKSETGGKSIVSVQSLISNDNFNSNTGIGMVDTQEVFTKMANNLGSVIIAQTTRLELIGDNTILVSEPSVYLINCYLRCTVENDENMGNLNPRSYPAFSKLVELAIKSYIYNHLVIKLDKGYIYNGHELGSIKDIIDGYSDAEEMYQEHLNTVWRKVAFLNNSLTTENYITSMFGNII